MNFLESLYGFLGFEGNELLVGSTARNPTDPPKVRLSSPAAVDGLSHGAITWNIAREGGGYTEIATLQGKRDERYRADPNNTACEVTLHLNDGRGTEDANARPVLTFRHDGIILHVPVRVG